MKPDDVVIQMYHDSPPKHKDVWMRAAWNYDIRSSAELSAAIALGLENPQSMTTQEDARVVAAVEKTFELMVLKDIRRHHKPDDYELLEGNDLGYGVYVLTGKAEAFVALADHWSRECIKDNGNIGGDDSYFDYFPDFCEGLWQLCKQINYPDAWNKAKAELEKEGGSYDQKREYPDDPSLPDRL